MKAFINFKIRLVVQEKEIIEIIELARGNKGSRVCRS